MYPTPHYKINMFWERGKGVMKSEIPEWRNLSDSYVPNITTVEYFGLLTFSVFYFANVATSLRFYVHVC